MGRFWGQKVKNETHDCSKELKLIFFKSCFPLKNDCEDGSDEKENAVSSHKEEIKCSDGKPYR